MTQASVTRIGTNGMAPATGFLGVMRMILGGLWDLSTLYTSLIQMKIHEHVFFMGGMQGCQIECKGNGALLTSGP